MKLPHLNFWGTFTSANKTTLSDWSRHSAFSFTVHTLQIFNGLINWVREFYPKKYGHSYFHLISHVVLCGKPIIVICLFLLVSSCTSSPQEKQTKIPTVVEQISVPAQEGSKVPNLFTTDQQLYLSWIAPENDSINSLWFSTFENGAWQNPKSIAKGSNWFVNWADFPSLAVGTDGTFTAHWLVKRTPATYDYDVYVAQSSDQGNTWEKPFILHADGIAAEHGFVSLLAMPGHHFFATWLDGRNTKNKALHETHDDSAMGPMSLRAAQIDTHGNVAKEMELDEKVCDCCQTDATLTSAGMAVVYRNRSDDEIRDIYIIRNVNGQWTAPAPVHDDGWKIAGCPVNGPAIDAHDQHVAVAWFTGANEQPKVQMAFSEDAGVSFSSPIQIDHGDPIGRVDVVVMKDGSAWVSWLEGMQDGAAIIAVHIRKDGTKLTTKTIASTSSSRASGFPIMEQADNALYFAWTHTDSVSQLRTAYLALEE